MSNVILFIKKKDIKKLVKKLYESSKILFLREIGREGERNFKLKSC